MIGSRPEPKPVPVRRYRYSKLRWRVLVHALDAVGAVVMAIVRRFRPAGLVTSPRSILLVQLDHMGDAVLTSPMLPRLRAAYPEARIDVLASPSNRAVFEADPHVDRVLVAEKNWFARGPAGRALGSAVWRLGRSLRAERYDLGIDVRGDVLTVLVLALAGVRRRVGWAMGGGGFLLTDVAEWRPGRHEVRSRMALLDCLGLPEVGPPRVAVGVGDSDRARVATMLRDAWPNRDRPRGRAAARATREGSSRSEIGEQRAEGREQRAEGREQRAEGREQRLESREQRAEGRDGAQGISMVNWRAVPHGSRIADLESPFAAWSRRRDDAAVDADTLHAGRFGESAPILAVHLGAGTQAKRWPARHWRALVGRFLRDGWRVVVVGGPDDAGLASALPEHAALRDWTGRLAVTETAALLERADLFIGADSGPAHLAACAGVPSVVLFSGTNRVGQWRPWSRRSLVLRRRVRCRPCHHKVCPLADHPCLAGLSPERVHRAARAWWARLHGEEAPHAPI